MKKTEDLAFEYQSRAMKAAAPQGYEIVQDPFEKTRRTDLKYNANTRIWEEVGGGDEITALAFYLIARKSQ